MKTAIVTGVAGFIGSHIAERLLERKINVIGIDSFTDYYSKKIKKNNINECIRNTNFKLIEEDILNLNLNPIFQKADFLFHEAAQPGVRSSWGKSFDVYIDNNIKVTQKILESAKDSKSFKKIIMASSSSVYGNQEGKLNEVKTIPKPYSPYGATKLASENLGQIYYENYNLPVCSLRYFTVYGPRQRPDMAFSRFIRSILTNEKITIFGDGDQTRDYTFVDDIISANLSLIENDVVGEIINIGGGNIISTNHIIELLGDLTEKNILTESIEKQKGDVRHTQADITKAKDLLNFTPKVSIKEGLVKEIEYYKNNLELYA